MGDRRHPLHLFAGRLTAALDELAGASPLALGVGETVETTVELTTALSQLRAVQLAVLAHAHVLDVAATVDATCTAAWLAVPGAGHRARGGARRQARQRPQRSGTPRGRTGTC